MVKKQAKYRSVILEIIRKIETGDYLPGDKIPSENELIKFYSISNTTARKCLHELEIQGWAKRIKGKGTFVLNRSEDKHLTRILGSFNAVKQSFNDNLLREGFTPKNVILEKVILENGYSSNIGGHQFIIEGQVLKIHCLRYGDDILFKDETRYISLSLCPRINLMNLEEPLLVIYEKHFGLHLENVSRTLGTTVFYPNDPDNYFDTDIPLAVFILEGAVICNNDKVLELEKSYYKGDKYKFSIQAKPLLISDDSKTKNV